jgi:hypothetical protein
MIKAVLLLVLLYNACLFSHIKNYEFHTKFIEKQTNTDTLKTAEQITATKNTEAFILGKIQKFTPWTKGKGANHMFWNWELVVNDNEAFPLIAKDSLLLKLAKFENKNVLVSGRVFYGIIIGSELGQNMTGYRIDAEYVSLLTGLTDTSRSGDGIRLYHNQITYIEGTVISYEPPLDNSKLGDEKIWTWEIKLPDGSTYPLTEKNEWIGMDKYIGKNVIVKGKVHYGIIFGYENTANLRGTRIDAEEVYLK